MIEEARRAMVPPLLGAPLGGAAVGLAESLHLLSQSYGTRDYSGMVQAVLLYSGAGLLLGVLLGLGAALLTVTFRAAPEPARSYATAWILAVCGGGIVVARYVLVRDVMGGAALDSGTEGALVGGFLLLATVAYLVGRNALKKTFFAFLLDPLGSGGVWLGLVAFTLLFAVGTMLNNQANADVPPRPIAPSLLARPNVLLIAVDGLRADALAGDGLTERAPTLARIARESLRFRRAVTHGVSTRASFASLLGSRVPCAHGAVGPTAALSDGVETLAEVLSGHGFTTGAIVTSVDTAPSFNFDQGFDTFSFLRPRWPLRASEASVRLALYEVLRAGWTTRGRRTLATHRDADEVSAAAVDWLRRHGGERWFLTLQYLDPTSPSTLRPGAAGPSEVSGGTAAGGSSPRERYDTQVAALDHGLGTLMDYLDENDLLDGTALVLAGLRGLPIDEGRGGSLRAQLAEEQVHVPLLLRLPHPGEEAGRDSEDLVRLVDVAPTISELVGASEGEGWQGVSLLREYALRAPVDRLGLSEARQGRQVARALRDGSWKLLRSPRAHGQPVQELFFLDDDPSERVDLARSPQASWKLEEESARLDRLVDELCVAPLGDLRAQRSRETSALSPEDCAVLRRLGVPEGSSPRCRAP